MLMGKLPPDILSKFIFSRVGLMDPSVIVGPSIGEDAAIIDLGDNKVLIAHVDPITGAVEHLGWLAVHVACNDIAVRGVRPRWLLPVLLLPESTIVEVIDKVTGQIDKAAREVGAMVVGGHSELTPGIDRPLVSMTAIGVGDKNKIITTAGARVGDAVIMTKTVATEGTAILATDFESALLRAGVPREIVERGKEFITKISVLREALALSNAGLATSMHDPTEGGLLGGLVEIAYASHKTIEAWEERIPIAEETIVITRALGVNPLRLISSGVLVATVPWERANEVTSLLERVGVKATVIGRVNNYSGHYLVLHKADGSIDKYDEPYVNEELNSVWERYS